MIIGNPQDFGLHLEVFETSEYWKFGLFNFIIDDHLIPGFGTNWTLNSLISQLSFKSEHFERAFKLDFITDSAHDLYSFAKNNSGSSMEGYLEIDITELSDTGCEFFLFSADKEERFIYTTNGGLTIHEKRMPKWSLMNILNQLPEISSL
jgi:hypothetical protein